ncbi:thiamine pyrophosphokinase [Sulfitobacter undariae]|uniref:Thiamine diphosphokinase n=1 Tax=Sulfitobacter undariae TaxID=1563671 RepID=A0A7W6E1H3_9RHOB|nr:thiamine diphosphokinase [Sulfitobacter undariae]MBB3992991.1 thiamine pyrophosphokinase [Sulfitobacter undariae]
MSNPIISSSNPVTLLGGGQVSVRDIADALTIAPQCVAVDGGLVAAQAAGLSPMAVIGDMDSAPPEALARVPLAQQHRVSEQQSTDFDKALRHVDAPVTVGVGFCGGRVDHQLAAFHTLLVHADRPCVLLAQNEVIVLAPPQVTLEMSAGDVVSLFPLVPVTGRSRGLEWPIDGLPFDPAQFVGTSNKALGRVELWIDAPGMLLIVPRRFLRPLVGHFAQGGARWPVHAEPHKHQPPLSE